MKPFKIMAVADVFTISGRPYTFVCSADWISGLPPGFRLYVGDKIELRRSDGAVIPTFVAGLSHAKGINGKSSYPIALPESVSAKNLPVGTEVWWLSKKED